MRQVPHYIIIGNGSVAKHLCYYFDSIDLPYINWYRGKHELELTKELQNASHILVAISDSQVDSFIEQHILPYLKINKVIVHFSGSLVSKYAFTTHPLQTFPKSILYRSEEYTKIPFIIESEGPEFSELLPGLLNPSYSITRKQKHYYHALCVMANNFTIMLWRKFFAETKETFGISEKDIFPFLEATFANLKTNPLDVLTGPIARNDTTTIDNGLNAMNGDEYFNVFQEFIKIGKKCK